MTPRPLRTALLVMLLAIGAGLSTASSASAHRARPATFIGITRACDDGRWATIGFRLERSVGRSWTWLEDRGLGTTAGGGGVEVHMVNGRYGPRGWWRRVPTLSGGEGNLRFDSLKLMSGGDVWDQVRIRYDGWTSAAAPGDGIGCGARP